MVGQFLDGDMREILVDLRINECASLRAQRRPQLAERTRRCDQHQAMKDAALRRRIEQGCHLLTEFFLLESMPVHMRLESVPPAGAALLRASGPVGPQLPRRRNRMRDLAVD